MSDTTWTPTDGSTTKELRNWIHDESALHCITYSQAKTALDFADRIDAKHEEQVRQAYDIGFASADDWYADKTNEDLAEHGLVRLPVDADGETWHVGDMVTLDGRAHSTVVGIELAKDGWNLVLPSGGYASTMPKCYHHYKPTPAERISGITGSMAMYADKDSVSSSLVGEWYDELLSVVDELEGSE